MAHFNFLISQNAKWGHAGFYIDCHRMTSLLTCAWLISILWLRTGKYSFTKKALGSGISWAMCKCSPRSRQITTPAPHHSSVFYRPINVSLIIINKYQTAVDQFWLTDRQTDAIMQWLTDCWSCTTFCCDSFSLLWQLLQWVMGFFIWPM